MPYAYHLPQSTALVCIGIDCLRNTAALQRHDADIVVSNINKLGGQ